MSPIQFLLDDIYDFRTGIRENPATIAIITILLSMKGLSMIGMNFNIITVAITAVIVICVNALSKKI